MIVTLLFGQEYVCRLFKLLDAGAGGGRLPVGTRYNFFLFFLCVYLNAQKQKHARTVAHNSGLLPFAAEREPERLVTTRGLYSTKSIHTRIYRCLYRKI